MKAITYHYIREKTDLPDNLTYLQNKNFKKQLDWFDSHSDLITKETFFDSIKQAKPRRKDIILTFDDGFADHYKYVFDLLRSKNFWGIFFISSGPYTTNQLLDVHRIHILLSNYGGTRSLEMLLKILDSCIFDQSVVENFQNSIYRSQSNSDSVSQFKKILNYYLDKDLRKNILGELIRNVFSAKEEEKFVKNFYLSTKQIKEMHKNGMLIGCHGVHHYVMSNLSTDDQKKEIQQSLDFLSNIIGESVKIFAYPYGTRKTFNSQTEKLLENHGIDMSFSVEEGNITSELIRNRIYSLPRFDCNKFKHGQNEITK